MPKAASEAPSGGFALGEIADGLNAELIGDRNLRIARIGAIGDADEATITFIAHPRYVTQLAACRAACVIVAPALRDIATARGAALVARDPYLCYARLTQWWARRTRATPAAAIHPSAVVDAQARLVGDVSIGAFALVGAGATVGAGACIGAHCCIGEEASIGASTRLAPRVTLGRGCSIGARGIVHSGVVIGADGFGFAPSNGGWEKIEQLGAVRIGDDCEIGANTCIDRGALGDTVIGDGVKLDNLIQIGHNVRIGAHTAIAGNAGIAGSAIIGSRCTIGGGAGVLGHLMIADDVHISAMSLVMRSIRKPGLYSGVFPIDDNAAWEKNAATLRQLHALRDRLRQLERQRRTDAENEHPT